MSFKIYTKTGDDGKTGLFGGQRVRKDDLRVEAYGDVDELNAHLGVARALCNDPELDAVLSAFQNDLFQLGADLATPESEKTERGKSFVHRTSVEDVVRLEALIDKFEAELPPLTRFILPGGAPLSASLHVCRVVCRRAERKCVTLLKSISDEERPLSIHQQSLIYLNRLSDLLFVLCRVANSRQKVEDVPWEQNKLFDGR